MKGRKLTGTINRLSHIFKESITLQKTVPLCRLFGVNFVSVAKALKSYLMISEHLRCSRIVLCPNAYEFVEVMRPEYAFVSCQELETVGDDGDEEIQQLNVRVTTWMITLVWSCPFC